MRKKEQLLWDAMKRNLPPELWMQRVENVAGDGMPDVYVGRSGKWVELKAPSRVPVRASTPLLGDEGMRLSQRNWFLKHCSMRGAPEAYILIRTPANELMLIRGSLAQIVNELPLLELRHVSIACTWEGIARELAR